VNEESRIRPRDRDAIIQSLRAGVVPRRGQQHIQVGRVAEIEALLADVERMLDGGSSMRFVIGDYGSGKTFFLFLVRSIALTKRLVTVHADLTPDRRLHSTSGHARTLYAEMMRNLSTRSKPDGGGLKSVVERFVTSALKEAREQEREPDEVIHERLESLSELVGGYDFASVVAAYWRGHDTGDEELKENAVRWLRAEFTTKTDARKALGVRTIIRDANFYDHLKLMARFVRLAGYGGLLVCLDELVNLYKLPNTRSRNTNYEQILRILNDSLQGIAVGVGFLLCGTPEFLSDTRKGLYSYPALQSRLAEHRYAADGLVDLTGPVVRLANLSPEDLFVLLSKIRRVYEAEREEDEGRLITDEGIQAFMEHCSRRIGDAYFRTPRSTIKEYVSLLAVLEQNPDVSLADLIGDVEIEEETNPDLTPLDASTEVSEPFDAKEPDDDDDLSSFQL
jgi:hypothetical protein